MTYLATSINQSPVITEKAGAAIEDVRGKAVKYDSSGNVILAAAGEAAIGVGILTNDEKTEQGADVDIQIKDMGMVKTGASDIKKGDELASDGSGKFVKATAGNNVLAIAMEDATASDVYIKALLVRYKTAAAG